MKARTSVTSGGHSFPEFTVPFKRLLCPTLSCLLNCYKRLCCPIHLLMISFFNLKFKAFEEMLRIRKWAYLVLSLGS